MLNGPLGSGFGSGAFKHTRGVGTGRGGGLTARQGTGTDPSLALADGAFVSGGAGCVVGGVVAEGAGGAGSAVVAVDVVVSLVEARCSQLTPSPARAVAMKNLRRARMALRSESMRRTVSRSERAGGQGKLRTQRTLSVSAKGLLGSLPSKLVPSLKLTNRASLDSEK